ncbi:MAG: type II secretion system protein [Parcubacteria group bacterium]|nr:MAG: type II secretion system protein [Parcubacteria group bacterium]
MKRVLVVKKSFTLIELLVVIAVIGLLASIILVSLGGATENAKVAKSVEAIRQVRLALELYADATGDYPSAVNKCMAAPICTQLTDPFLNSLGVPGWSGPYFSMWNMFHPWKGHIGVSRSTYGDDWDGDGVGDCIGIYLDDDAQGNDNSGRIPESALIKIDTILADGNLKTGNVRGGAWAPASCWDPIDYDCIISYESGWTDGVNTNVAVQGEILIRVGCYDK